MMRRQWFSFSLPSLNDSCVVIDTESSTIICGPYFYPETVCNQILSPEPCFTIPSIIESSSLFDVPRFYSDDDHFFNGSVYCNTPYGDGVIPENLLHTESHVHENVGEISAISPTPREVLPTICISNYGIVTLLLQHVRIDVSPRKAVYITNPAASCVAAISGTGDKSCIIHPNGKVLQDKDEIHISSLNRKAKITNRAVLFTSTEFCLSYVVDASGTKTTFGKFKNLNYDFSLEVFYDSMIVYDVAECHRLVNESTYKCYWNGDEVWVVGGFRIKQNRVGDVKITQNGERYAIQTSPTVGQMTVKTHQTDMTIGRDPNNYLTVRKGDKKVKASLTEFIVQNRSQRAGINNTGEVTLY